MVMWLIFGAGIMCGAIIFGIASSVHATWKEEKEALMDDRRKELREREAILNHLKALDGWLSGLHLRFDKIETAAKKKARRK